MTDSQSQNYKTTKLQKIFILALFPISSGPHCLCTRKNNPSSASGLPGRGPLVNQEGLMLWLVFATSLCPVLGQTYMCRTRGLQSKETASRRPGHAARSGPAGGP